MSEGAPRSFRILALDGGGIRGAFAAAALATLEADLCDPKAAGPALAEHFDLIAGTSTGGILALGLAAGLSPAELRDFYRDKGPSIFPATGLVGRVRDTFRQLRRPRHALANLERALEVLGDTTLGQARCRLVIPTYDAVGGRIFVLKTPHHSRFARDRNARLVDCALATAAAPTFFKASTFPLHPGSRYIDGGVWANCPALVGLIEAVHFLDVPLERIDILSIGVTREPFSVSKRRRGGGFLTWNKGLIDLLLHGQAEAAHSQASLLLDGRLHRLDQGVARGRFTLDDVRQVDDLINLGFSTARQKVHVQAIRNRFLDGVAAPPFHPFSG